MLVCDFFNHLSEKYSTDPYLDKKTLICITWSIRYDSALLFVRVSDGTTTVQSVPFTVNINDVNEFPPLFVQAMYSATVMESASTGMYEAFYPHVCIHS